MWLSSSFVSSAVVCTLAGQGAIAAITPPDFTSPSSNEAIKKTAAIMAKDLMSFYTGDRPGDVPGNLPDPYYWWEAGAMFGAMVNYWYYTGDTQFNKATTQALLHQKGEDNDYMPTNQSKTLGNDDQGFWGMAAMTAAETNFPEVEGEIGWLALAQGVFHTQEGRWDTATCGGGLRWQIFPFNNGFDYKNTISNGCYFNLGARLALYTGNKTYAAEAEKTWKWMTDVDFITTPDYLVHDGAQIASNCTSKDQNTWSYNAGIFLLGAAAMYNHTDGSAIWEQRINSLLNATSKRFFVDGVLRELCEGGKCNTDQRSFKGYLARWMAATTQLAPFTAKPIMALLQSSAKAATSTCSAGASGTQCGLKWTTPGVNDGSIGVGEQMSALEVVQSNLVPSTRGWVSAVAGTGNSTNDPNAGSDSKGDNAFVSRPMTLKDRVGAGIFTALILIGVVGGTATMMISE